MHAQAALAVGILLLALPLGSASTDELATEPAFEVLVVGTIHAPWQFRSRAFHPGHVRAALEAAKPDVIGVESNPTWFAEGKFHNVTYEAQGIAVPWAETRSIPVYGIDWMKIAEWRKRGAESDRQRAERLESSRAGAGLSGWAFGQVAPTRLDDLQNWFASEDFDFRLVNDIGSDTYAKKWLQGARTLKPFGGHRNDQIVKRCIEVMQDHRGNRLVVVIGAGHKAVLDEIFRRDPRVRLLQWEADVRAPTEEEAQGALTNEDRAVILGHNLDGERSYFHRELIDMERMQSILEDLKAKGGDPRLHAYFQARWHSHEGSSEAARALLEQLNSGQIAGPPAAALPYPFPLDHWRMAYDLPQAVGLERARLLLAGERRAEGETLLRALAAELPEPPETRDARWRMALLAKEYPLHLIRQASAPAPAAGARGARAAGAWSAADPAHGPLPIEHGEYNGPLHIELEHADGAGLPYLSRRFELPTKGGTWTFSARVRATGVARISIEAYVWPDGRRAETIATRLIEPVGDAWHEISLDLAVPARLDATRVNVYAARTAQGTLWLDAAQLTRKQ